MGHKQPPTPMQFDNKTELCVVKNNAMKKLKSMDMKFHWLRCLKNQGEIRHSWMQGTQNWGYCVTKQHPEIYHQAMRPEFLTPKCQLELLRDVQNGQNSQKGSARQVRLDWKPNIILQWYMEIHTEHQHRKLSDWVWTDEFSMEKYVNFIVTNHWYWELGHFMSPLIIEYKLPVNGP